MGRTAGKLGMLCCIPSSGEKKKQQRISLYSDTIKKKKKDNKVVWCVSIDIVTYKLLSVIKIKMKTFIQVPTSTWTSYYTKHLQALYFVHARSQKIGQVTSKDNYHRLNIRNGFLLSTLAICPCCSSFCCKELTMFHRDFV